LPPVCPSCGGNLTNHRVEEQFVIDIPPVEPVVTQFNVHIADCEHCGQRVQGRHPAQTSDALGAAAVQLGPRALGLAAELKHGLGVPYRKIERLFSAGFGLEVSLGGLARGGQRLARRSQATYQQLIQVMQTSAVVNVDETSWKISGEKVCQFGPAGNHPKPQDAPAARPRTTPAGREWHSRSGTSPMQHSPLTRPGWRLGFGQRLVSGDCRRRRP
jgi:transposase